MINYKELAKELKEARRSVIDRYKSAQPELSGAETFPEREMRTMIGLIEYARAVDEAYVSVFSRKGPDFTREFLAQKSGGLLKGFFSRERRMAERALERMTEEGTD